MVKKLTIIALSTFSVISALYGQGRAVQSDNFNAPFSINVVDANSRKDLPGAHVIIASRRDTIATTLKSASDTYANYTYYGKRTFRDSVRLTVTYVGYKPFSKSFSWREFRGNIVVAMVDDPMQITQIVVNGEQLAMVVRGDTTIYNIASFKTMQGDMLQQLIAQLPGLKIGQRGLEFNGAPIARIYIDGQRMFADNVIDALSNVETSDVKQVKVYEQQSEDSKRLGVTNARAEQVMDVVTHSKPKLIKNITVAASGGMSTDKNDNSSHDPYYKGRGSVGLFRTGRQFTTLIEHNKNVSNPPMSMLLKGYPAPSTNYFTGSVAYIKYDREHGDSTKYGVAIGYERMKINSQSMTTMEYIPTEEYANRKYLSRASLITNTNKLKLDLTTQIQRRKNIFKASLALSGNLAESDGRNNASNLIDDQLSSTSQMYNRNRSNSIDFAGQMNYRRGFRDGDYLSLELKAARNGSDGNGVMVDTLASTALRTHLNYNADNRDFLSHMGVKYHKSISKSSSITAGYMFEFRDDRSTRISLDQHLDPVAIDSTDSYNYTLRSLTNFVEAGYIYGVKEFNVDISLRARMTHMLRDEHFAESQHYNRNFLSLLPALRLRYGKLMVNYSSEAAPLSAEQLRNQIDISSSQLYVRAGNPNLKEQVRHKMDIFYTLMLTKSSSVLAVKMPSEITVNYISRRSQFFQTEYHSPIYDYTFASGSTLTTPINAGQQWSVAPQISYSTRINNIKSTIEIDAGYMYAATPYYISSNLNLLVEHGPTVGIMFISGFSSKFSVAFESNTTAGIGQSGAGERGHFFSQKVSGLIRTTIAQKYNLTSNLYYNYYVNSAIIHSRYSIYMQNISLSRLIGKKGKLQVGVRINDIFNTFASQQARLNDNYTYVARRSIPGRHWLIEMQYRF